MSDERVRLGHGSGGVLTRRLIQDTPNGLGGRANRHRLQAHAAPIAHLLVARRARHLRDQLSAAAEQVDLLCARWRKETDDRLAAGNRGVQRHRVPAEHHVARIDQRQKTLLVVLRATIDHAFDQPRAGQGR